MSNGYNDQNAKMQAYAAGQGISGTALDRPKKSPIEEALDRLAKMVECARHDLNELHARLAPVSQPVPIDAEDKATAGRSPATCKVEERISDITACVVAISSDLRAARNGLCI